MRGAAVGWGWIEQPDFLNLAVSPQYPHVAEDILRWFEDEAEGNTLQVGVLETEEHLNNIIERHGFCPQPHAPYFVRTVHNLKHLPTPILAPGFVARPISGLTDLPERVRVHQAAWSSTRVTVASLQRVMGAPPYRFDLDWVIEAPDGRFVASCLLWLDDHHGVSLMEPVGTDPEFRRQGLARAVCLYAMEAAQKAGATHVIVIVNPRGDEGYPIPRQFYRQIGFRT